MSKVPDGFVRVSKRRRCPVCGRPDWCLVSSDGTRAICPRTLSKQHLSDELGYLHILSDDFKGEPVPLSKKPEQEPPPIDWEFTARYMQAHITPDAIREHANELGVSALALYQLRMGWDSARQAYSFPMHSPNGDVIGMRLRKPDGFKFAVTGSSNGLFIPENLSGSGPLLIVEGPTDTAAAIDMGFDVIGRPSCSACVDMVVDFVERCNNPAWVIVEDHDEPKKRPDGSVFYPGQEGAWKLGQALTHTRKPGKIISPSGAKDIREWKRNGATWRTVHAKICNAKYVQPEQHNAA